jgi:circadian clock protein KaiC
LPESFNDLIFSPHAISFITHDNVRFREVEIQGQLRKIVCIVKMRRGDQSKDICEYEITDQGMVVGARLQDYRGLITGVPERAGADLGVGRSGRTR